MSSKLEIAVVQMASVDDIERNLEQIETLVEKIFKSHSPRLLCFPENCLYLRVVEGEKIDGLTLDHPAFNFISRLAQLHQAYFHLGSVPLLGEGALYNSSVLVTPQGEVVPTYKKIHLFDIQLDGQKAIRESDIFKHGDGPHIFHVDGWSIGETICYDLRFAELFSQYAKVGVDILLVPAAFLVKTGEAHWEVLLRARAIESQCYLIASAQGGTHVGKNGRTRETYGHSLIVEPWGSVVGHVQDRAPGFVVVTLQRDQIERVRQQIPMKSHRRLTVV